MGRRRGAAAAPRRRGRRLLRVLRHGLLALLVLVVVLTLASLGYNLATRPPATSPAPDGQDLQVHGARVHYRHWKAIGQGTGHPVVLVHGAAESTVSWQPMAELLARTHEVYAIDLPGYGYSEYTGRYSLDDEVSAVDGLVTGLAIHQPLLVGHSLGAAVVGAEALHHPDHVAGVIFADGDALPFPGERNPRVVLAALRLPLFTSGYRLVTRTGWIYRPVMRRVCGSQCLGLTDPLADAWMAPMRQGDAEQGLRTMAASGILHLEPAQIQRIAVPRAIIWGDEDASGGGSLAETRTNLRHPPEVTITHAGHLSMLAQPQQFCDAVTSLEKRMGLA